jgi:hypothetical protein
MPRIKTTPTVRVALWALRIYLLVLLSLIGLKFARAFSGSQKPDSQAAGTPSIGTNQPAPQAKP